MAHPDRLADLPHRPPQLTDHTITRSRDPEQTHPTQRRSPAGHIAKPTNSSTLSPVQPRDRDCCSRWPPDPEQQPEPRPGTRRGGPWFVKAVVSGGAHDVSDLLRGSERLALAPGLPDRRRGLCVRAERAGDGSEVCTLCIHQLQLACDGVWRHPRSASVRRASQQKRRSRRVSRDLPRGAGRARRRRGA
jgi:hypothetical protein